MACGSPAVDALPSELTTTLDFFNTCDWVYNTCGHEVVFKDAKTSLTDKKACCFAVTVEGANAATLERVMGDDPTYEAKDSNHFRFDLLCDRRVHEKECKSISGAPGVVVLHNYYKTPVLLVSKRDIVASVVPGLYLCPEAQQKYQVYYDAPRISSLSDKNVKKVPPFQQGAGSAANTTTSSGSNVFLACSTDHSKAVPEAKGYVRATAFYWMIVAMDDPSSVQEVSIEEMIRRAETEEEKAKKKGIARYWTAVEKSALSPEELRSGKAKVATRCRLMMMYCMDPNGSVPAMAVNMTNSQQIDGMRVISKIMKDVGPQVPRRQKK